MNRANSRALSLAFAFGALLGLAAILIGAGWSTFIKPDSVWPQEAAAEYKAANDALHAARERRPQAGDATAAAAQAKSQAGIGRSERATSAWASGREGSPITG